jgi:hypothetical protein
MYVANVSSGYFKSSLVLHMLLWLYMHVSRVLYVSDVVAMFHLNISKVDLEEAYAVVASALLWVTARAC